MDTSFKDTCMGCIKEKGRQRDDKFVWIYPLKEVIEYAYENTCESDLIRKVFVDLCAVGGRLNRLSSLEWEELACIPARFFFDLSYSFMFDRCECPRPPGLLAPTLFF